MGTPQSYNRLRSNPGRSSTCHYSSCRAAHSQVDKSVGCSHAPSNQRCSCIAARRCGRRGLRTRRCPLRRASRGKGLASRTSTLSTSGAQHSPAQRFPLEASATKPALLRKKPLCPESPPRERAFFGFPGGSRRRKQHKSISALSHPQLAPEQIRQASCNSPRRDRLQSATPS